jgi:hypothetical protein
MRCPVPDPISLGVLAEREELRIGEWVPLTGGYDVVRHDCTSSCPVLGCYCVCRTNSRSHSWEFLWADGTWRSSSWDRTPGTLDIRKHYPGYFDDLLSLIDCLYVATLEIGDKKC